MPILEENVRFCLAQLQETDQGLAICPATSPENLFYEDNCFVPLVYAQMKSYSYIRQCNYHYFVNTDSTTKKKNSSYLYDRFEIANLLKLRFKELNLEKIYKEELDFLLILNGFSGTVNASITTYTYINYDILQRCKEFVKKFTFIH